MRPLSYFLLGASLIVASTACFAQSYLAPPEVSLIDKNGVDLMGGGAVFYLTEGSLGAAKDGPKAGPFDPSTLALNYIQYWTSGVPTDNIAATLLRYRDDNNLQVYAVITADGKSGTFQYNASSGTYLGASSMPGTLVEGADGTSFVYTDKSGSTMTFARTPTGLGCSESSSVAAAPCSLYLTRSKRSNGFIMDVLWMSVGNYARPVSAVTNSGYKLTYEYAYNGSSPGGNPWNVKTYVKLMNLSQSTSPLATISFSGNQITTAGGETWTVAGTATTLTSIRRPGANVDSPVYNYGVPHGLIGVTSVVDNGVTTYYDYDPSVTQGVMKVTSPDGGISKILFDVQTSKVAKSEILQSRTDALNRTTTYDINSAYVVLSVTRPEGDQDVYSYLRGNLQSITRHPKPGSPLSDIVMSASYDATCSNILTCNNPNSVTDGRQNTTSYTYSANHGGVISELSPAPRAGKARPLKIYSYAQKYAYISDGAGGYVTAGTRIWVPVSETRCQTVVGGTTPTCDTAASKSVTTFEYGAENSANNLLLTATVVSADGVALRTCFRYDKYGNLTSTTSPRAELTTCQ